MGAALRAVVSNPSARLGVSAMATGHLVMIAVMAMTPVHIRGAGHDATHTLRIVGVVLSFHIAGMFAFSPIVGWLTDRFGRRAVIVAGVVLLLAACALAGTAGYHSTRLAAGLMTARPRLVGHHGRGVHSAQRIGARSSCEPPRRGCRTSRWDSRAHRPARSPA